MFTKFGLKIALYLLRNGELSMEDSNKALTALLDNLHATPFRAIIELDDEQRLIINGRALDHDQARQLRESAIAALGNGAFKIVREQVAYTAVTQGLHKAETLSQLYWGRVGLWWFQEELKYLELLAKRNQESAL